MAVAVLASIVLGLAVVASIWPVFVIWTTLLYCLGPRVSKKTERTIGAMAVLASLVAYQVASRRSGYEGQEPIRATAWFVGPLVVAAALVFLCGGPKRIRARRVRYEQEQSELRMERARLARANRVARRADRTRARRQTIRARTGLDVDLVVEAARDTSVVVKGTAGRLIRVAAQRVTQTSAARQARRPHRETRTAREARTTTGNVAAPTMAWLDLDTDINRIRSHERTNEILRLSDELDAQPTERRPSPTKR